MCISRPEPASKILDQPKLRPAGSGLISYPIASIDVVRKDFVFLSIFRSQDYHHM